MDTFTIAMVMASLVALVITIRVLIHVFDRRRIFRLAKVRGWSSVSVRWAPFAAGWFGEQGERHYRVTYADAYGVSRTQVCKTGLLTGIYWRDDRG